MNLEIKSEKDRLTIIPFGEIDHHAAAKIRMEADSAIEKSLPRMVYFDLSEITLMDSSGVGLILGRLRLVTGYGGRLFIINPSEQSMKILRLANLSGLIQKRSNKNDNG